MSEGIFTDKLASDYDSEPSKEPELSGEEFKVALTEVITGMHNAVKDLPFEERAKELLEIRGHSIDMVIIDEMDEPKIETQPIEEFLLENSEEPKVKSFDDLEAEFGDGEEHPNRIEFNSIEDLAATHDENGEPLVTPPPRLDYEQMADVAFRAIRNFDSILAGYLIEDTLSFSEIPQSSQHKWIARVAMVIQSASDPNDDNLARIFYAQDSMELMAEGWRYGETLDLDQKLSPNVAPWEYAKPEDKVQYYLLRRIVKSLLAVWNGH